MSASASSPSATPPGASAEASGVTSPAGRPPAGTDRFLLGLSLAVLTFWLFSNAAGALAPAILKDLNGPVTDAVKGTWADPVFPKDTMTLAVSLTALCSGMFIVVIGGLADRVGRVKVMVIGLILNIVGSLLLVSAAGALAPALFLAGRAVQGLSAACVMPTTLGLVRTTWDGPARARAITWWSIASFGGSGLSALVAGSMATYLGWRWVYLASVLVSVVALALVLGNGESRAATTGAFRLDVPGMSLFAVAMLALLYVISNGNALGWGRPTTWALFAFGVFALAATIAWEKRCAHPFLDLHLFDNKMFTGASLANFLLNTGIGLLVVTQQLLQMAWKRTPLEAGLLTLGYAFCVIFFMKVGEKLLRRFGAKRPMLWGTLLLIVAGLFFAPTFLDQGAYQVSAGIGYTVMGLALAFFGTPATDAAMSNLPASQAGAGAGIYKMASSLGSAVGTAISLSIYVGLSSSGRLGRLESIAMPQGTLANAALREAAMVAILVLVALLVVSTVVISALVPDDRRTSAQS